MNWLVQLWPVLLTSLKMILIKFELRLPTNQLQYEQLPNVCALPVYIYNYHQPLINVPKKVKSSFNSL